MSSQPVDRATQRRRFLRAIGRSDAPPEDRGDEDPAEDAPDVERTAEARHSGEAPADDVQEPVALAGPGPGAASAAEDGSDRQVLGRSSPSDADDAGLHGADPESEEGAATGTRDD